MSNRSPIYPIPEPQHFSDYGFDPQIDYFQVLEEARKQKRGKSRSIDALHCKLQKPISKEDSKKNKKKKKWWRNAFLFWRWKSAEGEKPNGEGEEGGFNTKSRVCRSAISGPVYITDSRSGSSAPYRKTSRPASGPLGGTLTPTPKGELEIPYLNLRDLNMEPHQYHRVSTSSIPIYFVT